MNINERLGINEIQSISNPMVVSTTKLHCNTPGISQPIENTHIHVGHRAMLIKGHITDAWNSNISIHTKQKLGTVLPRKHFSKAPHQWNVSKTNENFSILLVVQMA